MNKKGIVLIGFFLFTFVFSFASRTSHIEDSTQIAPPQTVVKTYQLKHITPEELINATRLYIIDYTEYKNTVSVKILPRDVVKFEELLKKIDVEQRDVIFKIYLIEAHRKEINSWTQIKDADLKKALQELGELWNFKSYQVEGPSFITIREGSGPEVIRLLSASNMNIEITNVQIREEAEGDKAIYVESLKLWGTRNFVESKFLETYNKKLRENGLLVAGVSGFGSDRALILVISAEVKPEK